MARSLILTHIFEKDLDKRIDKAEVLLISTIRVALPGSFAKVICKMWVRISHSCGDESAVPYGGVMGWEHMMDQSTPGRHRQRAGSIQQREAPPSQTKFVAILSVCQLNRYS